MSTLDGDLGWRRYYMLRGGEAADGRLTTRHGRLVHDIK